ncbi:DUF6491 family protein [Hyphococcus sp.]|uniref:DUF6491 family protein n=1 Tax=Hyphococcus sp. TaxID=2038636 RepID=UPI0035C6A8E6
MRKKFIPVAAGLVCAMMASGALAVMSASEKAQATLSKYEKTGESRNCLMLSSVRDTDPLDDYTLLVEASGGAVYLNELNGRCTGLGRERRYVRRSSSTNMCKGDIIRVIDSFGNTRGSCSLGAFEALSEISQDEGAPE